MKHPRLTDELREAAMMYAAGALDEKERGELARHLQEDDCAICSAEAREAEAAAQTLAMRLPLQTPSQSTKRRLMAQAGSMSVLRSQSGLQPTRSAWRLAAATGWALAAASLVLFLFVFNLNSTLQDDVRTLNARVVDLENRSNAQQNVLASLTSPNIRVMNLAGQGATPQARARIFWDEAARQWHVFVASLPQAASGRSYQMWFVPQGAIPVSAAVFDTSADGTAELNISAPDGIPNQTLAAAVTDEPAGGRPQPTGSYVLLGSAN